MEQREADLKKEINASENSSKKQIIIKIKIYINKNEYCFFKSR